MQKCIAKLIYAIISKTNFNGSRKAIYMDGNGTNQLVRGALLLTLAGIVSKILSAGYRIPLQNLTGDYGFYIYQQVYPILGMVLVLSLYGFPTAISKIMATLKTEKKSISLQRFYLPVLLIM